jgi:hypothetical protein
MAIALHRATIARWLPALLVEKRQPQLPGPMIYLIYRLEGDGGGEDAAAFDSYATWRGYTAARRRRPNAASDERAATRMEDEDLPCAGGGGGALGA